MRMRLGRSFLAAMRAAARLVARSRLHRDSAARRQRLEGLPIQHREALLGVERLHHDGRRTGVEVRVDSRSQCGLVAEGDDRVQKALGARIDLTVVETESLPRVSVTGRLPVEAKGLLRDVARLIGALSRIG